MKWFAGTIPAAIQTAKQNKVVFIVYIHGQDELSNKMSAVWESTEVSTVCDDAGCIAIKLAGNSPECGHFSQIYPVVVVPSTYFIGVNGVPLEVTPGGVEQEAFLNTIKNVIRIHDEQNKSGPSTASPNTPAASSEGENAASALPLHDRVDRAKQLLQQKREEKEKTSEEDQKMKEKERRKLGQDLQKLKQYQAEREQKETVEQMRKDRAEEKRQREKIKEQIARDREERAARFKKEKAEQEKAKEETRQAKLQAQQQNAAATAAKRSETARIQVRLPDGSSVSNAFPSSDPLQSVANFVTEHMGRPASLSQVFPKRQFTEEDMPKSLLSLDLAPSAVIIAIPAQNVKNNSNPGDKGGGILALVFAPFLMIWNFLYSLLFGSASSSQSPTSPTQSVHDTSAENTRSTGARPKTAYQRRPITRTDGNMRRLTDLRDDDDENATWNGNSTQQM